MHRHIKSLLALLYLPCWCWKLKKLFWYPWEFPLIHGTLWPPWERALVMGCTSWSHRTPLKYTITLMCTSNFIHSQYNIVQLIQFTIHKYAQNIISILEPFIACTCPRSFFSLNGCTVSIYTARIRLTNVTIISRPPFFADTSDRSVFLIVR